jgi:hypothetical protein
MGWGGEGRERKGEEGRDGKRAGGSTASWLLGGMDATGLKRALCRIIVRKLQGRLVRIQTVMNIVRTLAATNYNFG